MSNIADWVKIMSERLSIVIPTKLKKQIDELKELTHLDQSSLIRQLLSEAIHEKKLTIGIETYQQGRISLGKAVELAESNYWSFIEELHDRNIAMNVDYDDFVEEIKRIEKGDFEKFI